MAIPYDPNTNKIIYDAASNKIFDGCCCQLCNCDNSEFVLDLDGVLAFDPPLAGDCTAGNCAAVNGVYVLPQNPSAIVIEQANCILSPAGSAIFNNPDHVCAYQSIVSRCGTGGVNQNYQLDAVIYWVEGVGWVSLVGLKMPASKTYNFQGGNVADVCMVLSQEVFTADSFDLCNFSAVYTYPGDSCGTCGTESGCDFNNFTINGSVEPV